MQPKARITVRFDPPPQSPNTARTPQQQPKLSPLPETPMLEDNRTQDDASLLEQLIRRTDQPVVPDEPKRIIADSPVLVPATPQDGQALDINHELEIDEEIVRISGAKGGIRSREEGPSWWKVFASAAGAIATGALFGYLVLTLFSGSPHAAPAADNEASPAAAGQAAAAQAKPADRGANTAQEQASADDGSVDQPLPAATYYWLQYGVFRSPEAMEAAVQELRDAGLPGWGDESDGYRVYAGVATDKSEAEQLAGQMPGHEVFIKSIRSEDDGGGVSAQSRPFVADSRELVDKLSRLSVAALQDKMPEPFEADELAELRASYENWRSATAAVEQWQAPQQQEARSMMDAFEAAMASVDQYGRKVSRYHLWNIQADLMKILTAERKLQEALAAAAT